MRKSQFSGDKRHYLTAPIPHKGLKNMSVEALTGTQIFELQLTDASRGDS